MTLSELIKALEDLKAQYGEMEVLDSFLEPMTEDNFTFGDKFEDGKVVDTLRFV